MGVAVFMSFRKKCIESVYYAFAVLYKKVSLLSGLTDLEQLSIMMNPCVITSGDLPYPFCFDRVQL